MIKPGYKTSEFWFTLVSFVFSGLFLVGLLDSNSQKEDLITETSRGLEAFVLISGQLVILFKYLKGRTEIKKIWSSTVAIKQETESSKKTQTKTKRKQNEPVRNTKTRTRKPSSGN
jgi:hypothetical protein